MPHVIQTKGSKIHNHQLVFNDECDHRWRRVKSAYKSELFSARALESQVGIRERKIWELVRHLGLMDGRVVKIKEVVTFTAINIISRAMVSRDFVDLEGRGEGEGLMQNVRRFAEVGVKLGDLFAELSGWDWQGTYKEFLGVFGWCCGVWVSMVEERRGSGSGSGNGNGNGNGRDFADALIESGFSDDQINAMFMVYPSLSLFALFLNLTRLKKNVDWTQPMRAKVVPLIIGTLIHLFEWSLPGNMDPANLDHEKEKNSITYNLLKGSNPHALICSEDEEANIDCLYDDDVCLMYS
ncbi:hypothetical protein C3L33_03188, partial [Rhododendron williamsianum]